MLKREPENIEALAGKADYQRLLGDYELALATCEEVLKLDAQNVIGLLVKGQALNSLERFDEALAAFQATLAFSPENARALWNVAYVYYSSADYDKALEHFDVLLSKFPDYADGLNTKAWVLRYMGRLEESIQAFELLLEKNPRDSRRGSAESEIRAMREDITKKHWLVEEAKTSTDRIQKLQALYAYLGTDIDKNYKSIMAILEAVNREDRKAPIDDGSAKLLVLQCRSIATRLNNFRHFGQATGVLRIGARFLRSPSEASGLYYDLACFASLASQQVSSDERRAFVDESFAALDLAQRNGWRNHSHALEDRDLFPLHGDSRWQEFLDKIKS